MTKFY